ncbi:hypothetical protein LINPERHAP1_LOCUS18458 [Linum perenne]
MASPIPTYAAKFHLYSNSEKVNRLHRTWSCSTPSPMPFSLMQPHSILSAARFRKNFSYRLSWN